MVQFITPFQTIIFSYSQSVIGYTVASLFIKDGQSRDSFIHFIKPFFFFFLVVSHWTLNNFIFRAEWPLPIVFAFLSDQF